MLAAIAKKLVPPPSAVSRQRTIRRHLNRIQDTAGVTRAPRRGRTEATRDLQRVIRAGDVLRDAQRDAGVKTSAAKVGDDHKTQRAISNTDAEAALAWTEAEVTYCDAYRGALKSSAAARMVTVSPVIVLPAALPGALADIEDRRHAAQALADEIRATRDKALIDALAALRELR